MNRQDLIQAAEESSRHTVDRESRAPHLVIGRVRPRLDLVLWATGEITRGDLAPGTGRNLTPEAAAEVLWLAPAPAGV